MKSGGNSERRQWKDANNARHVDESRRALVDAIINGRTCFNGKLIIWNQSALRLSLAPHECLILISHYLAEIELCA